ncbi:hypothetical protein [Streptosporangium roseum]|uniref:hypothetical protein n=1 Tax=Streptosporangium roseum TaxID=2001 RepID=UPI0004CCF9D9|nr:hypothetical protein [Streptosporangium roseum]
MAEPWAPTLEQVADHIPTRTRDSTTPGSDTLLMTFNADTTPTDEQARRYIDSAVAEVLAAVAGTVPATPTYLRELARKAAALRAAADIELAYPDRDADVEVAAQLDQRAKDALLRLVEAVSDAGGTGTEGSLLPVWSMPVPGWPGDYPV